MNAATGTASWIEWWLLTERSLDVGFCFVSNGSRRDFVKRRISFTLGCHKGNEVDSSRVPLAALEEQPSNSSLDSHGFQRRHAVLGGLMAALLLPSTANPAFSLPSGTYLPPLKKLSLLFLHVLRIGR